MELSTQLGQAHNIVVIMLPCIVIQSNHRPTAMSVFTDMQQHKYYNQRLVKNWLGKAATDDVKQYSKVTNNYKQCRNF